MGNFPSCFMSEIKLQRLRPEVPMMGSLGETSAVLTDHTHRCCVESRVANGLVT